MTFIIIGMITDKILWAFGNILKKTLTDSAIELNFNEPEYSEVSMYETGDITISLGSNNHDGYNKTLMVSGDDSSTISFGSEFYDMTGNSFSDFDNSRTNMITLSYLQGTVYVTIIIL